MAPVVTLISKICPRVLRVFQHLLTGSFAASVKRTAGVPASLLGSDFAQQGLAQQPCTYLPVYIVGHKQQIDGR